MKYFLIGLCVLLIYSCKRKAVPINEIIKIEYARSGAWQDWGAAVSMDSALTYKYYGGKERDRHYYLGKVTPQLWDRLSKSLNNIDYKKIKLDDDREQSDVHYYELIIYWKNEKKRIIRHGLVITDSLSRVASMIDNSYKKIKLIQVPQAIKFGTTFQNEPPMRDINRVRFPPPIKSVNPR